MNKFYFYTGEVHTGKTTDLLRWTADKKNVDGIFQPVVESKRFIYHLGSRALKRLETDSIVNVTTIGNYKFDNDTFEWAQKILLDSVKKQLDWLIIDEIGPLELAGKGLEPAVSEIIKNRKNFYGKILCVVRDSIFTEVIRFYKLENDYTLFELE
jgi:nucleoside-triphosphatase THEP1